MSNSIERLPILEIDIDQWRREVQTFAESTQRQLAAINDQLASGFSGAESKIADSGPKSFITSESQVDPGIPDSSTARLSKTEQSLTDIRQKLAARLKTRPDTR